MEEIMEEVVVVEAETTAKKAKKGRIQARVSEETEQKFKEIAREIEEKCGPGFDTIYQELMEAYKLKSLKTDESSSNEIDRFLGYVQSFQNFVISLMEQKKDIELTVEQRFKNELMKRSDDNESLSKTIKSLQNNVKELESTIDIKDEELEKLTNELDQKNKLEAANNQSIDLLKSNITDLKAELNSKTDSEEKLRNDMHDLMDKLMLKKEELAQSKKECELLNLDKNELIAECSKLQNANEELHEDNSKMYQINNENLALKKEINDYKSAVQNKENTIVNLNQALALEQNNNNHLEEKVSELKDRIKELKEELTSTKNELQVVRMAKEKEKKNEENEGE